MCPEVKCTSAWNIRSNIDYVRYLVNRLISGVGPVAEVLFWLGHQTEYTVFQ